MSGVRWRLITTHAVETLSFCSELEGSIQRQTNPHPRGSLADLARACAGLGGWTDACGKPGPAVMLAGWLRFQAVERGARLQMCMP